MPTTTSPLTPATHGLRVAASFNPFCDWQSGNTFSRCNRQLEGDLWKNHSATDHGDPTDPDVTKRATEKATASSVPRELHQPHENRWLHHYGRARSEPPTLSNPSNRNGAAQQAGWVAHFFCRARL